MKRLVQHFIAILVLTLSGTQLYSQCTPDPSCTDINEPGELCPNQLADGVINVAYSQVITIIPPASATIAGNTVPISYIVVDSITNIPAGMTYTPNTEKFWADSVYCILIEGTPEELGEYNLEIYVTPWVYSPPTYFPGPQVANDTSVVIHVKETLGIDRAFPAAFSVTEAYPNPFSDQTKIEFSAPISGRFELEVYNLLGVRVYYEEQVVMPGEYSFSFDGSALSSGSYVYTVSSRYRSIEGQLIKK